MAYDNQFGFRNDPTDPVMRDRDAGLWGSQASPVHRGHTFPRPDPEQVRAMQVARASLVALEERRRAEAASMQARALAEATHAEAPDLAAERFIRDALESLSRSGYPGSSSLYSWYLRESRFRFAKTRTWGEVTAVAGPSVRDVTEERFYRLGEVLGPPYYRYGDTMRDKGTVCLRLDGSRWLLLHSQLSPIDDETFGRTIFQDVAAILGIGWAAGLSLRPPAVLRAQPDVARQMAVVFWRRWEQAARAAMTVNDSYAGSLFDPDHSLGPSQTVDVLFDHNDAGYPQYRAMRERDGWPASMFQQQAWPIWHRPDGEGLPLTYWLLGTGDAAFGLPEAVTIATRKTFTYSPEWFLRDFERAVSALEEAAIQA
jgi:hypothetical protein